MDLDMIYIFFQLFVCVVAGETTTTGVIAKFETDFEYSYIELLGKETIVPLLQTQIPVYFPSIQDDYIVSLNINNVNGISEFSIELDPETPDLDSILDDVESRVDAETAITVSTFTVTTTSGSFAVINRHGATTTAAPKLVVVKFDYLLPWGAVDLVGEATVIQGLKEFTPRYIRSITRLSIVDVQLEERNNNVGVDMMLDFYDLNIYNILLEAKEFVECGTVIRIPGQPEIKLDRNSFGILYPEGEDAILNGDERILCPGQTTTPTPRVTRRFVTNKPATAGSARPVEQLYKIMAALAIAIWITN